MAKALPPRPRREDSYFGLHFDLHPNDRDRELGRCVDERLVRRIIQAARPDYIQYDCKGHVGYLGYPRSKVSQSAGGRGSRGIVNDALGIYRKVTARMGVALYVHFSGVYDLLACKEHPEWAALGPDGKPNANGRTSTFGPYVTQRMIPQMKEIVDRYEVDGFWVDGECWGVVPDYCAAAAARFKELTTKDHAPPTQAEQPYWTEWLRVHRDQFFAYLKEYMDAVHAHRPGVQIASNWLYTPFSPEPIRFPVDFISGDYNAVDSVNSARLNGRYMASVGLPWDLMAWAHSWFPGVRGSAHKPPEQLMQEAATIIALGGGFQVYYHPDRHGGFADWQIDTMGRVADFCHARKEVCFKTQPLPQVAMLIDTASLLRKMAMVYAPWHGEYRPLEGLMHAALEAGHSVDVVADHMLPWQQDRFPVIVVPEWEHLPTGLVYELVEYAQRGGSLLVAGATTTRAFGEHLGVEFIGGPEELDHNLHVEKRLGRGVQPGAARVKGPWQKVALARGGKARVLARRSGRYGLDEEAEIAATIAPLGRGKIAAVYGPLGLAHFQMHNPLTRDLVGAILDRLYRPRVRLEGPRVLDMALRQKDGRWIVHLNNTTRMAVAADAKADRYFFVDRIPPVGPVELRIRCAKRPSRVTLQPGGTRLAATWARGELRVTVPSVHIHAAVVLEC